ncbi:hypothetical protein ACPF8X_08830 [Streptomyces sp. G35A]
MPVLSIRRRCAGLLDRLIRFTHRNVRHLPLACLAAAVFVLVLVWPVLGTPAALALTVITLRRRI